MIQARKIDWSTLVYYSAETSTDSISIPADQETTIQSLSLSEGRYLVLWQVRLYAASSSNIPVYAYLKNGSTELQRIITNYQTDNSGTLRGATSGAKIIQLNSPATIRTTYQLSVAGHAGGNSSQLIAIRVG